MDITSHGLTETEMIRITQLKLPCGHAEGALEEKTKKILRLSSNGASHTGFSYSLVRHSVDARKKPQLFDIYTVDVETGLSEKDETALVRRLKDKNISIAPKESYVFPVSGREALPHRPVVIGAGPAGLFCALFLAEHGYRPLLIERGKPMEERAADVARFWEDGVLDPASNVQFGEGGAGTFSDGKLNTQINDKTGRSKRILEIFVDAGASPSILYEALPHIGTDRLRTVIPNIRRRIEAAGGEVLFNTLCTGISFSPSAEEGPDSLRRLNGIFLRSAGDCGADGPAPCKKQEAARCDEPTAIWREKQEAAARDEPGAAVWHKKQEAATRGRPGDAASGAAPFPHAGEERFVPAQAVVLAIGHSARDTLEMLRQNGIPMEQKQFAVGLRVAHPQELIDESQYGISDKEKRSSLRLSASPYKLAAKASSGRGVYSFCMCPGGLVVNASSEEGYLCVNGMSDEGRAGGWANSAVVITVGEKEFGGTDVFDGLRFQRRLEKKAFELGRGRIPAQRYVDLRQDYFSTLEKGGLQHGDQGMDQQSGRKADQKADQKKALEKDWEMGRGLVSCLVHQKASEPLRTGAPGPEKCPEADAGAFQEADNGAFQETEGKKAPVPPSFDAESLPDGWSAGAFCGASLRDLLPKGLTRDFIEGMEQFGKRIAGFDGPRAIVAGIESRTSSPVRILRGKSLESTGLWGLYPCGEGAGYAGGIMSAAMDGIRAAEAVAAAYAPFSGGPAPRRGSGQDGQDEPIRQESACMQSKIPAGKLPERRKRNRQAGRSRQDE